MLFYARLVIKPGGRDLVDVVTLFQPRKRKFSEGFYHSLSQNHLKIHSVCSQVQMKLALCCFAGLV